MGLESLVTTAKRRPIRRGDPGVWAWVLHRITGAAIFFFLFVRARHRAGRVSLRATKRGRRALQEPDRRPFRDRAGGRGAVHALNGIRVILVDFWTEGCATPEGDARRRGCTVVATDRAGARGAGRPMAGRFG